MTLLLVFELKPMTWLVIEPELMTHPLVLGTNNLLLLCFGGHTTDSPTGCVTLTNDTKVVCATRTNDSGTVRDHSDVFT